MYSYLISSVFLTKENERVNCQYSDKQLFMLRHIDIQDGELRSKIRHGELNFAGNAGLRIYGRLSCTSGKRMKKNNRVFFNDVLDALQHGFRPCGHCLKEDFKKWKDGRIESKN